MSWKPASSGPLVSAEEVSEVMARDLPADLRLAIRMPRGAFEAFHDTEQIWAFLLEEGLIDEEL